MTIRQLARIEKGESFPNLQTLEFMAKRLSIPLSRLLDKDWSDLPRDYVELKNQLIRRSIYGDENRVKEQEGIFDRIYEQYYDNLPYEEQLVVEILQATCDVFSDLNPGYSEALLEEHLPKTLLKLEYSTSDLLILYLYFLSCLCGRELEPDILEKVSGVLIEQKDFSNLEYCSLLQRNMINLISCKILTNSYEGIPILFKRINHIMEQIQDYHFKPVVDMLEAKYYLFYKKDKFKAEYLYQEAIVGAGFLKDKVLQEKIRLEREQDFAI